MGSLRIDINSIKELLYYLKPSKHPSLKAQTMRQLVSGAIATIVDLGCFQLLVYFTINPYLANLMSLYVGTFVNFVLIRCYVFADFRRAFLITDFCLYCANAVVVLVIQEACIGVFYGFINLSPLWAKIFSVPIVFIWSIISARFIFIGKFKLWHKLKSVFRGKYNNK